MPLSLFDEKSRVGKSSRRGPALAMSLGIHSLAFFVLMSTPEIRLPPPAKSEYQQALAGKEEKIVWYRLNEKLPGIAPPVARADSRPLRAEAKAQQQIVASPKAAPKREQFVYSSAPQLPDAKPVDAPNLLAIRFEPPAPPAPKLFVPPPLAPAPELADVRLQDSAPPIATKAPEAPELPGVNRRIFRRFVPPTPAVKAKLAEIVPPPEAPQLASTAVPTDLPFNLKTPGRRFAPPPVPTASTPRPPTLEAPPAVASQPPSANALSADLKDLNLAIVSLKPAEKPPTLPASSNPGQFSAAPEIHREGADSAGGPQGITVPDLFVRGAPGSKPGDAKPSLMAEAFAAPTAASTLRQALRTTSPRISQEEPPPPPERPSSPAAATKVSGAPDPRFTGRDVYMMAIQMPNLTSYSGSWLMWYSDRMAHEAGLAPVSPPIAHRKVDPKYVAAAISDRVEGTVRLACVIGKDGKVSNVELVRGLDERLNRSAEEALAKWEFTPATRQGQPVDVDVLVEIPFRLQPLTPVAF
jgi:TonB family protein